MELVQLVINNAGDIIAGLTAIVTGASILANLTKTESDNKAIAAVSKLINLLALNLKK